MVRRMGERNYQVPCRRPPSLASLHPAEQALEKKLRMRPCPACGAGRGELCRWVGNRDVASPVSCYGRRKAFRGRV